MNYLLTGANGFLGKYIFKNLSIGSNSIYCIGRNEEIEEANYIFCDLALKVPLLKNVSFDKVIHVAGMAHLSPKNKSQEDDIFTTNFHMASNLILALDQLTIRPKQVILISSVAVYGSDEGVLIAEEQPTNPISPYGKAKLESEKLFIDWCFKFKINLLILRLPLVAGKNAPGNLGAIKRAIKKRLYIKIRSNTAKKSIVLASDVANLINYVDTGKSGIYNLTDRCHPSIEMIEHALEERLKRKIIISLPFSFLLTFSIIANFLERIFKTEMPINLGKLKKLTNELTFNDDNAVRDLAWKPNKVIDFLQNEI